MTDQPGQYDIVLLGATGFAGRLTAMYIAQLIQKENFRFALSGRNLLKLRQLADHIHDLYGVRLPCIQADTDHQASLQALCRSTSILMSAVGPYVLHGEAVISACLDAGTHYLDITGEPAFVKKMWHLYSARALEKEVTIVHCCGFDSVPADTGAFRHCNSIVMKDSIHINAYVTTNATYSSGTIRSAILALSREFDRNYGKENPSETIRHHKGRSRRVHFCTALNRWALPMPVIDPAIVKRTAQGMVQVYGQNFSYSQYFTFGSLFSLFRIVLIVSVASLLLKFRPLRNFIMSGFKPGEGPSDERRAKSLFTLDFFSTVNGQIHHTRVNGADPGYDETAKMFAECAICQLTAVRKKKYLPGFQTPVLAWESMIEKRLSKAGIVYQTFQKGEG